MKLFLLLSLLVAATRGSDFYFPEEALDRYMRNFPVEVTETEEEEDPEDPIMHTAKDLEHQQDLGVPYDQYQYMSGGAGKQHSKPLQPQSYSPQEVKTDKYLPAYCNPPNPCPLGQTSKTHKCQDQYFHDTAEFNKRLQEYKTRNGHCACDTEHMFHCPRDAKMVSSKKQPSADELDSLVDKFLEGYDPNSERADNPAFSKGNKRENLIAKKSPPHSIKKRSVEQVDEGNPYLNVAERERLPVSAKKSPPMI